MDDVASREGQFGATPKLIVLFDGVRLIVEDAKIVLPDPSTDEHPHALDGNRLFIIVHGDAEDQLGKVAGLERLAPLQFGEPESFRRFTVKSLTVL
jgi:hypothetical protein